MAVQNDMAGAEPGSRLGTRNCPAAETQPAVRTLRVQGCGPRTLRLHSPSAGSWLVCLTRCRASKQIWKKTVLWTTAQACRTSVFTPGNSAPPLMLLEAYRYPSCCPFTPKPARAPCYSPNAPGHLHARALTSSVFSQLEGAHCALARQGHLDHSLDA